ncbi:Predicted nuclease of the RNAse H fold, HicB family [Thiothrix eikelboomii]|uniref:Predicted nuclease of the RNAse H fold, HicB family n=1 Tax=Thiothrix eikelboomii TaxID=92487 RepID=A0A1T4XAE9_9GAMM|nr:type II toxin-antitoxin system HicB family antitoxin [Thiothrix eikelboomii]SKA86570.1 Predicted nuclease of the RNAse H fold, HicB family [Thiothrix eikelboomii]
MNLLEYKGYLGSVEAAIEDGILFGKLEFISALISYEGETVKALQTAFEAAVDDYLASCEAKGYEPELPCKGSFNVRVGHDLHLAAMLKAKELGISLNDFVRQTLNQALPLSH